ncbi:hypothetical protein [Streptomyces mutabilis]|uniref:Uncharacterized protein n=1 Tax=Streptomyces mutabilis TaxID=67332 RepID=A0A086MRY1_9ACTN|nr:hypothetical protein [Streptomyces mutabilis]KFG71649.1 hypothetical protein FM21_33295 [Streptomyces mutabilis]
MVLLVQPAPGEQHMPGSGLGVTQPQLSEVAATCDERVLGQCVADHLGHGVALLVVELCQEAEHPVGDARSVLPGQAREGRTAHVAGVDVQSGIASGISQRAPELIAFGSAR